MQSEIAVAFGVAPSLLARSHPRFRPAIALPLPNFDVLIFFFSPRCDGPTRHACLGVHIRVAHRGPGVLPERFPGVPVRPGRRRCSAPAAWWRRGSRRAQRRRARSNWPETMAHIPAQEKKKRKGMPLKCLNVYFLIKCESKQGGRRARGGVITGIHPSAFGILCVHE